MKWNKLLETDFVLKLKPLGDRRLAEWWERVH